MAKGAVVVMQRLTHLRQVIGAGDAVACFTCFLHCRQQQAKQHGDDRNHHQELDQGKALTAGADPRSDRH